MGPCSLIQKALPRILDETPESWFNEVVAKLENNAKTSYEMLTAIPGLYCTFPTAAMYLLLGVDIAHFPDFASDVEFCAALVKDQALFCIPGQSFGIDNHMRLVIAAPNAVLVDACERLKDFCAKYYVA
jgi:tyrosine aminotransferase